MEKPFLTPKESDRKMSHSNWKYQGDRFRAKLQNELVPTHGPSSGPKESGAFPPITFPLQLIPQFKLQQQAYSTSYAIPCTFEYNRTTVQPSPDPTVNPQCATCLRLLGQKNTCITENNMYPNGTISDVAVNTNPRCNEIAALELNKCGVQCGQPQNYERPSGSVGAPPSSTSVSCWPPQLVAALSG